MQTERTPKERTGRSQTIRPHPHPIRVRAA